MGQLENFFKVTAVVRQQDQFADTCTPCHKHFFPDTSNGEILTGEGQLSGWVVTLLIYRSMAIRVYIYSIKREAETSLLV